MTDAISDHRKIELKGKYLRVVEDYVDTLELSEKFLLSFGTEWSKLIDTMADLHRNILGPDDVEGILINECISLRHSLRERTGPLSAPQNKDVRDALVSRLKSFFESLPRKYTLRIQLPSFPPAAGRTLSLAPDVRLVYQTKEGMEKNRLATAAYGPLAYPQAGERFMEFDAEGYSDHSARSPAASACISLAKQYLFIAQNFDVCSSGYSGVSAVAAFNEGTPDTFGVLSIPERLGHEFAQLKFDEGELLVNGAWMYGEPVQGSLLGHPSRAPQSEEEVADAIEQRLQPVRRYFNARSNPDFESIAAAIEWFLDSQFAENDTFAYIAACIGLEAILGSSGHVDGLSKRLTDRYAFMLGGSRKEREEAISQYTRVLNLRGKLVHAKAARLGREDRPLLFVARRMLLQVLRHELRRIYSIEKI